jgi:hypothetical protein
LSKGANFVSNVLLLITYLTNANMLRWFTCKGAHHAWLHQDTSSGTSDKETTSKVDVHNVVTTLTSITIRAELG